MKKWLDVHFVSSSTTTDEFKKFAKDFKAEIKYQLKAVPHITLEKFNRGHFFISGFVKNAHTGKMAYFMTGDVRDFYWYKTIVVRTAEHDKDYTGGTNNYIDWAGFAQSMTKLTERN